MNEASTILTEKTYNLGCLRVRVNLETGGILGLVNQETGTVYLDCESEMAGPIDMAQPLTDFEPFRRGSKYGSTPQISDEEGTLRIHWDNVAGSLRGFQLDGAVSVTVTLSVEENNDVILRANVSNQTREPIRQVLFPFLPGLLPFCGEKETHTRTLWHNIAPFPYLKNLARFAKNFRKDRSAWWSFSKYNSNEMGGSSVYKSRWVNYGGLKEGLSLHHQKWSYDPYCDMFQSLSPDGKSFCLCFEHRVDIAAGEEWDSGNFCLTPHRGGWVEGLEAYEKWISEHQKREFPLSKSVKEGLGMRTVWMCDQHPQDPKDVMWKMTDLPDIAREAKEYGLTGIHMWQWQDQFVLPLPPPLETVGTEDEMAEAAKQCNDLNVRLIPMIEWSSLNKESLEAHGQKYDENGATSWMGHHDMVPRFNPYYSAGGWGSVTPIDCNNERFLGEVLTSWKKLIDMDAGSIFWDQFWSTSKEPNHYTTAIQGVRMAKEKDPDSLFIVEDFHNPEGVSDIADLFDATHFAQDTEAYLHAFRDCRPYWLIDQNRISQLKKLFANNMFFEVGPTSHKIVTGSDTIHEHPELAAALAECNTLRQQFLPFFTDGTLVGDCVLNEHSKCFHVAAHTLGQELLVFVVNLDEEERATEELTFNVADWLNVNNGYQSTQYNPHGDVVNKQAHEGDALSKGFILSPLEISVLKISGTEGE